MEERRTVLITGGCGFIGSNLVRHILVSRPAWRVVNVDLLTYAGIKDNLRDIEHDPRYVFVKADIADVDTMRQVFEHFGPWSLINCAAETHVDRSLNSGVDFVRTNVLGTQVMLEITRLYGCRLVHVSTDEVYGSLGASGSFQEESPLRPNSPYAASKAAADLLALAAHGSFGQDVVITRCSNNYGPYQHPEKLISLIITNAIEYQDLPVYGKGENIRDWLHVADHCRAVVMALEKGKSGRIYNFGGGDEMCNISVVRLILSILGRPESLIRFVADRPGHDFRYSVDFRRANEELGWKPEIPFQDGLIGTVRWYVENEDWWRAIKGESYKQYYDRQYGTRLGGAKWSGG